MKALVRIIFVLVLFSQCLFAQDSLTATSPSPFKLRFYSGLSIPMEGFGDVSGELAGFANTGFFLMFEGINQTSSIIDFSLAFLLSVNGMNDGKISEIVSPISAKAGSYYTGWLFSGIELGPKKSKNTRFYLAINLGLLYSSFPDITLSYRGTSITQTTESDIAIAYGFGAGLQINQTNVGIRYFSANPKYEQNVTANGINNTVTVTLPAAVLLFMIGVTF